MKKRWQKTLSIILISAALLTGCSTGSNTTSSESGSASSNQTTSQADSQSSNTSTTTASTSTQVATLLTTSTIAVETEFTAKDLEIGYDESSANVITLDGTNITMTGKGATATDGILTITDEGTYILNGDLKDGQVIVAAEDTAKVQIVLNGVNISCSNNAPIYIKSADKVFITLADGTENLLTDGSAYVQADDNTVDGVIFSKVDLTINGNGTMNITANYKHGIVVKDKLAITSGNLNITAVKDAINSNDSVKIKDGTLTLSSTDGNGISCKNKEDETKGYVYICGGEINVTNCVEGIEGTAIVVEGGSINITSQDDGFNASNGMTSASNDFQAGDKGNAFENDTNCYISISGGTINVDASGDGVDSNGALIITGGTIYVSGPTENNNGALDYNGTADISGGTIVVAGSSGMAQGFSDTSTQYSILNNLTSTCAGGTAITLTDSNGNVVASFTPNKEYQSVVISTPELVKDGTYTLTCGDETADLTLSSVVTSNGQQQMMGGPGGGNGFPGGDRPQRNDMNNTTQQPSRSESVV